MTHPHPAWAAAFAGMLSLTYSGCALLLAEKTVKIPPPSSAPRGVKWNVSLGESYTRWHLYATFKRESQWDQLRRRTVDVYITSRSTERLLFIPPGVITSRLGHEKVVRPGERKLIYSGLVENILSPTHGPHPGIGLNDKVGSNKAGDLSVFDYEIVFDSVPPAASQMNLHAHTMDVL